MSGPGFARGVVLAALAALAVLVAPASALANTTVCPPTTGQVNGIDVSSYEGTIDSRLLATGLPAHASIDAICNGRGCPFQSRAFTAHGTRVNLASPFAHHTLASGVTLEVFVAVKGEVAKVFLFRMRRSKGPLVTRLCQAPGAPSPATCAA